MDDSKFVCASANELGVIPSAKFEGELALIDVDNPRLTFYFGPNWTGCNVFDFHNDPYGTLVWLKIREDGISSGVFEKPD